jgi:general secretion pathway protein A
VTDDVLPSRGAVLAALTSALLKRSGPVVLTGDAGVGKTWLCRKILGGLPASWRWLTVDLSPATGPAGLYGLILRGLGLPADGGTDPAASRGALEDVLLEAEADGQAWVLVVDEAHNGSDGVLEELRVLSNRPGEPGAFAGLLLAGQGSLLRRLKGRALAALGSRASARAHLRALGYDEFRTYLAQFRPAADLDDAAIERLHRSLEGNPRLGARALGQAQPRPRVLSERPTYPLLNELPEGVGPRRGQGTPPPLALDLPPVLPVREPLQVGDGVVEVGWNVLPESNGDNGDSDPDGFDLLSETPTGFAPTASGSAHDPSILAGEEAHEEVVDDRYTALQAWNEWARNQGRTPAAAVSASGSGSEPDEVSPGYTLDQARRADTRPSDDEASMPGSPSVWAEGQQGFAPYSQLFSRLRQPRESQ